MSTPRVVLVTGASSGIGEATARAAASRGDHVVLLARGEPSLERVAEDCRQRGAASTLVLPTDVADDDGVRAAVTAAVARHGRLDIVVGCAGVVAYGRIQDVPVEVFDRVLDTNLHGSANLARHVVPVMRDQGTGSLVLVGSLIGHLAVPDMSAYVLSKWGVRVLVRQLRVDNRDRPGLTFGYVAPGGVDTPIYRQAATYGDSVGRPPFPVVTPERVAARALAVADRPWLPSQVGAANEIIKLGYTALPWAYDRLVGPLFRVIAQDLVAPVTHGPGNVLEPDQRLNALRGDQGNALVAVARNVREVVRRRTGR
ncbi:SDR family NAD(P)-dependent oxidoreductase [Nocardioides hwasunensis]|uniref:SDR family NAD(P)-dependent oxidoreductase n=1 Tax=Nocardioides hwasunensis TaxID=397258 RepID=A0ABR8MFE2_9ACTN|nr:SDR family NAD(P)-dependent oxidoreductase [Nocardioides hwasunensis]MBD3914803.1 SDR family NAD(P)-dependent oxidoreductase [Nocardioides hwasunensis]